MNYASIIDAYGTETLSHVSKKKKKKEQPDIDYDNENEIENYKIEEYKKDFSEHCEPLQPPHYKLPISDKVMKNYNNAYQVFLKDRKINQLNDKNNNNNNNNTLNVPVPSNKNNKHTINIYDNYNKIRLEDIKEIEPYYDEDLDNYLNINEFNSSAYEYDDTYQDEIKNELMKKNYDLKTQEPLKFNADDYILIPKKKLKSRNKYNTKLQPEKYRGHHYDNTNYNDNETESETDINIDSDNESENNEYNEYNDDITHPPIIENFKRKKKEKFRNNNSRVLESFRNNNSRVLESYNPDFLKKNPINNFYKNIINIGLFILIGVFIIFLLDLLTELALHKGMKQTVEVLIPLLEELKALKEK